jgi:predicted GNAT family acetyltransferase
MVLDPAFSVVHLRDEQRFSLRQHDVEVGELTYDLRHGRAALLHTEVHPRLRGRGLAHQLVRATVDWARAEGLALTPVCWYTRVVLERTGEFQDVL